MQKIAALVGILGVVGVAFATEARVDGMGGPYQYMLDDEALIINGNPAWLYAFTGRSVLECNTQSVLNEGNAYGGVLFNWGSFGVATYLNEPIYYYPTLDTIEMEAEAHGFTFVLGSTGEGMKWATRIGLAMNQYGDTGYTVKGTGIDFAPGIVMPMGEATLDAMLDVKAGLHSDNSMGEDLTLEPISPLDEISLGIRYIGAGTFKWIFGGGFYMTDYGTKRDTFETIDKTMGGGAFMGFNVNPTDNSLVVGGLNLGGYQWKTNDDASIMSTSVSAVLGGEASLNEWFTLRAGLSNGLFSMYQDKMDTSNTYKWMGGSGLGVYLGTGVGRGPVRFDATVSEDLLYNGPYFVTGETSGLVGKLSLLYKFRTE